MIYLILLLINVCIVLLWDYMNWPGQLANQIAEVLTSGKIKNVRLRKPLGCSCCMTIILSLIYLFVFNGLTVFNVFYFMFLAIVNGYLT